MPALEAGPRGAPLVVLLHGFPDLPLTWRRQVGPLAAAGFRVVAPELRGYGSSPKPAGIGSYRIDLLVGDVAAVVRAEGARTAAAVVGHDWGGAIAWNVPRYAPGLAERIVILNSPHPKALLRDFQTLRQLRRSWYMFFFQLPALPEALLRRDGYAGLSRLLARALRGDPGRASRCRRAPASGSTAVRASPSPRASRCSPSIPIPPNASAPRWQNWMAATASARRHRRPGR